MIAGIQNKLRFSWRTRRAIGRVAVRLGGIDDPWQRTLSFPPSTNSPSRGFPPSEWFRAYYLRESHIEVRSLDDVCNWLLDCEYQSAPARANDQEDWPPPADFEGTRRGACGDHALWAWRSLVRMGFAPALVWGQTRKFDEAFEFAQYDSNAECQQFHAWVEFNREGVDYLFDSAMKREEMVRPRAEVRPYYLPWFAVDTDFRRHRYYGWVFYRLGIPDGFSGE